MNPPDDSQLSAILDRFVAAWDSCRPPEIRDFLPDESAGQGVSRQFVLIELIHIDLERRWRANAAMRATHSFEAGQLPDKPAEHCTRSGLGRAKEVMEGD